MVKSLNIKLFFILISILSLQCSYSQSNKSENKAQKLKTEKYSVCGVLLDLEVADEDKEQTIGLMYRTEVPTGTGMIFIYPEERIMSFWMRNVPFDIDIAFFDKNGKYLNHYTMVGTSVMQRPETLPSYPSEGKALYAVEVEKGFYSKFPDTEKCRLIKK